MSEEKPHDPVTVPNKIFCPCGNQSLAQITEHICAACEDLYVLCWKCANPGEV